MHYFHCVEQVHKNPTDKDPVSRFELRLCHFDPPFAQETHHRCLVNWITHKFGPLFWSLARVDMYLKRTAYSSVFSFSSIGGIWVVIAIKYNNLSNSLGLRASSLNVVHPAVLQDCSKAIPSASLFLPGTLPTDGDTLSSTAKSTLLVVFLSEPSRCAIAYGTLDSYNLEPPLSQCNGSLPPTSRHPNKILSALMVASFSSTLLMLISLDDGQM